MPLDPHFPQPGQRSGPAVSFQFIPSYVLQHSHEKVSQPLERPKNLLTFNLPRAPFPRQLFPAFPALSRQLLPLAKAAPAFLASDPSPCAVPSSEGCSGLATPGALSHSVPWNAPHIQNHPRSILQWWLGLFWWLSITSTTQELKGDPQIFPSRFPPLPASRAAPCLSLTLFSPASSQSNGKSPSIPKFHLSRAL